MTKRTKRHTFRHPHPIIRRFFFLLGVGFLAAGAGVLWIALTPTPDLGSFATQQISQSTKIYDRTGETVLYDLNPDVHRTSVPLSEVSDYVQKATISIEDADFYNHGGVSITAIFRSIFKDILSGSFSQGGSTLTQQVVKNTLLTRDKTIVRKVREWILAWKLEQQYTKNQILEFYFNDTSYGGNLYGIEAASRAFFGKSAKDLSLGEAAYLAAIPQAPTYYSPYGNNRASLDTRKNLVLDRMRQLGYITDAQYKTSKQEVVTFNTQTSGSIIAPHFVFYIQQQLEDKYGPQVATQGLSVITTLDVDLQHDAETTVATYAAQNATKFNAHNAALVALDPKTGQILAMVGSKNYFDPDIDGNFNAALANRQPGSAFKPFVYAAALAKGYTPQTAIFDLPTQFSTSCSATDNYNDTPPCYSPSDYDDKFRGPMTFTTALQQSINVPAVKALYLAGIANVIDLASRMGITTLGDANHYGLSLALGAAEVRLLDLTSAYGAFANDGELNPATGILKITDKDGKVLEEFEANPKPVVDAGVAHDLSSMLSNNEARFPEYPPDNPLHFTGYDVAAKTGTTNDFRDAWTVGYTPTLAVGVWAGNNDNSPMVKEIAGYIVAPMWHAFMNQALPKVPKEFFGEPRGVPDGAPGALLGNYVGADGRPHDILYFVNKNNPLIGGGSPGDSQYNYWEYPVAQWSGANPGFTGQ